MQTSSSQFSGFSDPRVTEYLPCRRIVLSEGIDSPDFFIGREFFQPMSSTPPGTSRIFPAGSRILLDFGEEISGGIRLVTGRCNGRIRLRFGESVSEALSTPNQDHAIHDTELAVPTMGVLEYGNTGFRFVCIDAVTELNVINILAISRYRALPQLGSFECNDERLNQIWRTSVHTVHLCMQEYIYDGVKRDRLVWQGDMHPELSVINLVYGDTQVSRQSLDFVRDMFPLPKWMNGISSYSLWWLICQCELYMHHGDLAYLKEQHSYIKGLAIQLAQFIGDNGEEKLPDFRFIDWPTQDSPAAIHQGLQALMVLGFRSVETMAKALKDTKLAQLAATQRQRLMQARRLSSRRKSPNALAVIAGLQDAKECNRNILSKKPCQDLGTFMGYYTLFARCLADDFTGALNTIRQYWGAMLDLGATSFWEHFEMDWARNASRIDEPPVPGKADVHADFGGYCFKGLRHSLCHGWAGGPAALLMRFATGLTILKPGFKQIRLKPQLGDLEYFTCTIPTPYGPIQVEHDRKASVPNIKLPDKAISCRL